MGLYLRRGFSSFLIPPTPFLQTVMRSHSSHTLIPQMCHRKSKNFVGQERALDRLAKFAAGGKQQPQVFLLYG